MAEDTTLPKIERKDISHFIKKVWFFLCYFALLLMIASFGIIAES